VPSNPESAEREAFVPFRATPARGALSANVGWVVAENGCHIWQGSKGTGGYGDVRFKGKSSRVHRVRYELEVGPIPEGMQLDHFACDTPICCNPAHLRPVTQRENSLRSSGLTAIAAARTHCAKGHPFDAENTHRPHTGRHVGKRCCRACDNARKRERYRRKVERLRGTGA
jgi:hypothetical protein